MAAILELGQGFHVAYQRRPELSQKGIAASYQHKVATAGNVACDAQLIDLFGVSGAEY